MTVQTENLYADTQVVSLAEARGTNNFLVHPRDALGVVTRTSVAEEKCFLVRFLDGLESAFARKEQLDIDALLMGDVKSILVDKRAFMSPRLEYRLRFSVAHEIGHLILHRDIYAGLQHATAAEWFDYISAIPEVEYGWVEWQAYEFAGRLLVPPDALREAFQAAIQSAQAAGYSDWLAADEAALDYIATRIAPKFGVSAEVIAKRLRVEKLWPPLKQN